MPRIILALAIVTLTSCAQEPAARREPVAADSTSGPAPAAAAATDTSRIVLFVGTSLTAGFGVGHDAAWPAVIQERIDSAGLPFRVVNAGISGETSAGGLRRIEWSLQQPADVLVLELGANDALRGLAVRQLRENLAAILTRARAIQPDIALVLIGMEAPPNMGDRYAREFRAVFTDLARRHDAALVPFLLEDVAAAASLNIEDGIHPNAEGHRILARTVWRSLEPVLRERATRPPATRTD